MPEETSRSGSTESPKPSRGVSGGASQDSSGTEPTPPSGRPPGARSDAIAIEVRGLEKRYHARDGSEPVVALTDINLEIKPREFVSVVGPSGCGKSTLLMSVAGLVEPTNGYVAIGATRVTGPPASVSMMFQTPELFPWRNVLDNVFLPIDVMRRSRKDYLERARHLLEMVGLGPFERAFPNELSGGMQQRVALCRALVADPGIVLMDEPFGALDEFTRERLNVELLRIWQESRKTVIFVTHNITEAVFLSDRVVVMGMNPGRVLDVVDVDIERPRSLAMPDNDRFHDKVFEIRRLFGLAHE